MRLDLYCTKNNLTQSRSQAENYIRLGMVKVNNTIIKKAGYEVRESDVVIIEGAQYVSRAALKLASIADQFKLNFKGAKVLDVGSSTGGFTDYALQHGAEKVIAVDVGTNQLHPSLRFDQRVQLHEKTDIRDFKGPVVDYIVADVSFISLRLIMPALRKFCHKQTLLVIMCKPQFEAGVHQVNKGIIKNSAIRRQILKDFEEWLRDNGFKIVQKADSQVAGTKGNVERFYLLSSLRTK